ncbi:Hermansky-Pudlak syndrome 5 protein homolog [Colias croceus]|uniref:Hermansky-Pudlak syndrome 5 protein homolog n=1 Tax=Colias crocea TaxID=72248 RepID=UPI001E27E55A|nr:Hermansky-Pudlak syndrome 5 protein homolog [Colias croceus]
MSDSKLPPFLLQELPDITESVNFPIKNIQRIKYTCFDVSKSLIAFGATSGGIYVFNRWPCEFIQLIPNKDGPVTRLAISADEKHIGFANGKGMVTVTECDQTLSRNYSTTSSKEHLGNEVTAMIWSRNMLFNGDDVGKISVLQLQSFIAKTMFHSSSQTIMSLDSRICQLDTRDCMLLVSTLTRCYICNTAQEQYRQIGQKLRDGEFGACFVTTEKTISNGTSENNVQDITEVKKYNIVDDDARFVVGDEFSNTLIYCARPSSRVWEATVDGMVRRTHQFKQVLAKPPIKIVTVESYENENLDIENTTDCSQGQSVNFSRIYSMNSAIFSYNKHALYFLNIHNLDDTIWCAYSDIVDCKLYHDILYVWLSNGSFVSLKFIKIDKFLVKCYLDEKYVLCGELCALYKNYLLENNLSLKMHILVGLKEKLRNNGLLKSIEDFLDEIEKLKPSEATQLKSGIFVVDNSYHTQSLLDDNFDTKHSEDNLFNTLSPEALQALKGLSETVSGKFNTSKKILKEKWEDFEEKMKYLGTDRNTQDLTPIRQLQDNENAPKWITRDDYTFEDTPIVLNNDIIFKESSQETIEIDNNLGRSKEDKFCKLLYQYARLSLVNKESELSNLTSIIEDYSCDIHEIHELMLSLEQYCVSVGALDDSKFVPNNIFLTYLNTTSRKGELLELIINNEVLYKYFVDSCISANVKTQKLMNIGCECGFPLPYIRTSQMPVFSNLIDEFIERQWSSQTKEQCYEICKRMPYLWKKILYLRRNEDLLHVLRILLQMLDESLLHSFLPQFTLDTWDRAIQLYATLHANICLNCNKKFDNISVKDMLSWDDLGALIIKSIGGRNAINVMKKHGSLIDRSALTIKFYHTSLMVCLYEKYDVTITIPLVDTLYSAYEFEESRMEVCSLLQEASRGNINNTALPLIVSATSQHWGLENVYEIIQKQANTQIKLNNVLQIMTQMYKVLDCSLCGLPLQNEFLIQDGGLWAFKCGHVFHGACLRLNKIKLCPSCTLQ